MSFRVRLTLLLFTVVTAALAFAWLVTGRAVLGPFSREVMNAHVDQVLYLAKQIEDGADPRVLSENAGLEVRVLPRPPRSVTRERGPGRRRCHREQRRGYEIFVCRGPHAPVAVKIKDGWVVARRDLDDAAPARSLARWLSVIGVLVLAFSAWAAGRATRPLRRAIRAMERITKGDLSHRLPVEGSREIAEVATAFNAMADRVDTVLRAEKELMAGISHELRTPLARLRLELEILREQDVSPKRLDSMEADLSEIDSLIGELLTVSKLSIGEQQLERAETDLGRVVAEALERTPLPHHQARLEGEAGPIVGDHPRLVRAVSNLLQNAGKYAPHGTEISVKLKGRSIEIADRGPGVPVEDLPKLFEPFYRGERGRTSSASGLGLGLMIARQIALLHGGTIEAHNREGGGLSITFELPAPE